MVVLTMDSASESLRGECTRYLIEIKTGVFIGTISARVRDSLWNTVKQRIENGAAIIAYSYPNEQGFVMEMYGDPRKSVIDIDGLQLIKTQ